MLVALAIFVVAMPCLTVAADHSKPVNIKVSFHDGNLVVKGESGKVSHAVQFTPYPTFREEMESYKLERHAGDFVIFWADESAFSRGARAFDLYGFDGKLLNPQTEGIKVGKGLHITTAPNGHSYFEVNRWQQK